MAKKTKSKNVNHPKKGASIKVEPIRSKVSITAVKRLLKDNPRDLCLFTFGINTAYRASEILSLTVGQVAHLGIGDRLEIKQKKTKKYRAVTLNKTVVRVIHDWLAVHPDMRRDAPLFVSQRTKNALSVPTVSTMVKMWCADVGLEGNYGSHSMRKTWGYHQRVKNKNRTPVLMAAFGHTSEAQTLEYLCIQDDEISELYAMEL